MSMKKAISTLLLTVLGLALLAYSAARSLNFIMATLPADKQILAYFGLAALDGGLLLWLGYFLSGASGPWQRGAALLMVGVDLVGAVAMFTLDTLYESGQTGMTASLTESEIQTAILALSGVIAVNIAAVVFSHIMDPDARKTRAIEESKDKIEDKALEKISKSAELLAENLSNDIAAAWQQEILATYRAALVNPQKLIIDAQAQDPQPAPSRRQTVELSGLPSSKLDKVLQALGLDNKNGKTPARQYSAESEKLKNETGDGGGLI